MIRAFYAKRYAAYIGDHVMPMQKFAFVRRDVEAASLPIRFDEPRPASESELLAVHDEAYVRAVATGEPRALAESQKFPWSAALADSVLHTNGGTIAAARAALEDGIAANVASGFHHAHADHGEGFCTFNGLVVAVEAMRREQRIERALVVDLDLHFGNGTASLVASRPFAHTLSVYGSFYKDNRATSDVVSERVADTANAWSVAVPNGATGDAYLDAVRTALGPAIERARPELVLYQAGADPYREDPYSPLDVDHEALLERDRLVFAEARRRGIPIAWVLAGGYTKDIAKIVLVHVNTFRAACSVFAAS